MMDENYTLRLELELRNDAIQARRLKRAELRQALAELEREDENDNKRVMIIASQLLGL